MDGINSWLAALQAMTADEFEPIRRQAEIAGIGLENFPRIARQFGDIAIDGDRRPRRARIVHVVRREAADTGRVPAFPMTKPPHAASPMSLAGRRTGQKNARRTAR